MSLIATVIRSTDPSTPTLSGTVGTGYQVAKHCLLAFGWTLEYEYVSGQRGVFRNSPVTGSGHYLEIDDTGGGTGGAQEMLLYGWESYNPATQVGTNKIPTAVVQSFGTMIKKSFTTNATSRAWRSIGTERDFYLFTSPNSGGYFVPWSAFDLRSRKPGDAFNFVVAGHNTQNIAATNIGLSSSLNSNVTPTSAVSDSESARAFIARAHGAAVGAIGINFSQPQLASTGMTAFGGAAASLTYPDPVSAGLVFERIMMHEGARLIRGFAPGVYAPQHNKPFSDDTLQVGALPGGHDGLAWRYNRLLNQDSPNYHGQVIFDVTGAW